MSTEELKDLIAKGKIKVKTVSSKPLLLNGVYDIGLQLTKYNIYTDSYETSSRLVNDYIRYKTRRWEWETDNIITVWTIGTLEDTLPELAIALEEITA